MKPLETRVASEFLGTTFLVADVVGSGIMGERLAGGNVAIALLANTIATGAALVVLVLTFGPISGAHFNPVVTLADALEGGIPWAETLPYILAQILGGIGGAIIAHLMFGLPVISLALHARTVPRNGLANLRPHSGCSRWCGVALGLAPVLSHLPLEPISRLPIGSLPQPHLRIPQSQFPGASVILLQAYGPSM